MSEGVDIATSDEILAKHGRIRSQRAILTLQDCPANHPPSCDKSGEASDHRAELSPNQGVAIHDETVAGSGVTSLPALVRRAAAALAGAETAAEVLEAKALANFAYDAAKAAARFARAKGAFDEVMSAVYRSQADALEIEAMAKRRIADEYDTGLVNGTMRRKGQWATREDRPVAIILNRDKLSRAEVGLAAHDINSGRKISAAELVFPGITGSVAHELADAGTEPTKAAVSREVNTRLGSFSGDREWYIPAKYRIGARGRCGGCNLRQSIRVLGDRRRRRCREHVKPRPSRIFVAGLAQMRIAFQ